MAPHRLTSHSLAVVAAAAAGRCASHQSLLLAVYFKRHHLDAVLKTGVISQASGSAYAEFGNTKASPSVDGPLSCQWQSPARHTHHPALPCLLRR